MTRSFRLRISFAFSSRAWTSPYLPARAPSTATATRVPVSPSGRSVAVNFISGLSSAVIFQTMVAGLLASSVDCVSALLPNM